MLKEAGVQMDELEDLRCMSLSTTTKISVPRMKNFSESL